MNTFVSRIIVLSAISITFVGAAQTGSDRVDLCGTQAYSHGYNASGSVTIPGFRVNDTYEETEWTWTRYVSDEKVNGTDNTSLWQTFGLETTPELNLTDPTLPYTGCIIVPRSVMVSGREDDGTCRAIFNSGCIDELIQKVNESASAISQTQRGSAASFSCPSLIHSITTSSSSKCADQWHGTISTEFLSNNFSPDIAPRRCVPENSTGHPFFGWQKEANSKTDFRDYDQAIRTPHPVIVAMWLKVTDADLDDPKTDLPGWADTRLFCIPANNTRAGSRSLAVANRTANGRASRDGVGMVNLVIGFMVAVAVGMGL